jgi:GDPmannose 4,6-dehydratase
MAWRRRRRNRDRRQFRTDLVEIDPRYFRPTEVDVLLGDPGKAHQKLGWHHKTSFPDLVAEMVDSDLTQVRLEKERMNRHD